MKQYLVCINAIGYWINTNGLDGPKIIKGNIYTLLGKADTEGFICLQEFGIEWGYRERLFRPVDDTFGICICEILEEQIQYEEAETILHE